MLYGAGVCLRLFLSLLSIFADVIAVVTNATNRHRIVTIMTNKKARST